MRNVCRCANNKEMFLFYLVVRCFPIDSGFRKLIFFLNFNMRKMLVYSVKIFGIGKKLNLPLLEHKPLFRYLQCFCDF